MLLNAGVDPGAGTHPDQDAGDQGEKYLKLYVTGSGKTSIIAYLKMSRNAGFKYLECVVAYQLLKLYVYKIFTRFIPIPYLPEHSLHS